jgi:hypothetical protein
MQKTFLAISAISLCVLFAARSSHADSIHSPDLKLDSSVGVSGSRAFDSVVDSQLLGDDLEFHSLGSWQGLGLSGGFHADGEKALASIPEGALDRPMSSHLVRRFETGNAGPSSDDPAPATVPEPSPALLAGIGILALAFFAKARRSNRPDPPITV